MKERVKNQIYNSVSLLGGVALRPDTTNRSPDVPAPHNSAVWNSTQPISAAVVSTACPHSWACHRPQIRPLWLFSCIPVITPENMLIPTDSPQIYGRTIVSLDPQKKKSFHIRSSLEEPSVTGARFNVSHIQLTPLLDSKRTGFLHESAWQQLYLHFVFC